MAILLNIGKKGAGKSTLLRRLIWRLLGQRDSKPLFFVHDPHGDFREVPGVCRRWPSVAHCRAHIVGRGALTPVSLFAGDESEIEAMAKLALEVRDVTLVLDELDRSTDGKKWLCPSVKRIVHEGRHGRVGLWGGFRRPANVSEDLLTQADLVFFFRVSEMGPYDLQGLERRIGPDRAAAISRLGDGEFIAWSDSM